LASCAIAGTVKAIMSAMAEALICIFITSLPIDFLAGYSVSYSQSGSRLSQQLGFLSLVLTRVPWSLLGFARDPWLLSGGQGSL
jgi:hypothetical protein